MTKIVAALRLIFCWIWHGAKGIFYAIFWLLFDLSSNIRAVSRRKSGEFSPINWGLFALANAAASGSFSQSTEKNNKIP